MTVKEAIVALNVNAVIACERAGFSSAIVKMIEDALDTIEDALKERQWVNVKDRLPNEYNNYLVVARDEVTEATFDRPRRKSLGGMWSTCDADGFKWLADEDVTYWMPLPELPKGGDGE